MTTQTLTITVNSDADLSDHNAREGAIIRALVQESIDHAEARGLGVHCTIADVFLVAQAVCEQRCRSLLGATPTGSHQRRYLENKLDRLMAAWTAYRTAAVQQDKRDATAD